MISKEETLQKINISLPSYASEKIRYASDPVFQEKNDILVKIKEMRKIAQDIYYDSRYINVDYYEIKNRIFFEQAKFMVDVEDHYEQSIFPDYSYSLDYESLEIPELRTYFTWRSHIRRGEYPKIHTKYILIYFSELINLIGVSSPEDAFDRLVDVINFYYDDVPEIYFQKIFEKVPKDFVINYGLPVEKLQKVQIKEDFSCHYGLTVEPFYSGEKESKEDTDLYYQSMLKVYNKDYANILKYLAKNSSYKILSSRFYQTKYGFLIEKAIPDVFQALEDYFYKLGLDFASTVLGEIQSNPNYRLFHRLFYYEKRKNFKFSVVISEIEEYCVQDKTCIAHVYMTNPNTKIFLGVILKQIEARLREKTGYKRKIKVSLRELEKLPDRRSYFCRVLGTESFLETINQAVDYFLIERQKEIKKDFMDHRKSQIIIDSSTFDSIRASTFRVQEKLVTEEERQEELDHVEELDLIDQPLENKVRIEEIPEQETVVEMGIGGFLSSLTKVERHILIQIIEGVSRNELECCVKEKALLLEVVIENINLKALDYIGDNLVEDFIDGVCVYEDYVDEIKEKLENMEV